MKKYSVFELYVIKVENYYFICEKSYKEYTYNEIFTKEVFQLVEHHNVEPLSNYYSLLAVANYTTGKPLTFTKKELLVKYAEINSSHIERKKHLILDLKVSVKSFGASFRKT